MQLRFSSHLPLLMATVFAFSLPAQIRLPNQAAPAQKPAEAETAPARAGNGPWTIEVPGRSVWVDTGIDLKAGDTLRAETSGSLTRAGKTISPDGGVRGWTDMIKAYPVTNGNPGALIGRIGTNGAARAFLIGSKREAAVPAGGRLFLSVNFTGADAADGAFQVKIERVAGAAPVGGGYNGPAFTQELLDQIPLRVQDDAGTVGDRTNFVIIGTEKQVIESLEAAGWVRVDKDVKSTIFRGALSSLSKQAYVTIPMSLLKLFDRYQDFGWAQADPVQVVAARHHFRLWKAPFDLGGRTVWVGAGTHDVGFDKDQRNGKLTHKIDPEVDKERDYIGDSLKTTGVVARSEYLTPKNPIKEAKTAHGQAYFSDGRTLILYFHEDGTSLAAEFGKYFCNALAANPDGGTWEGCNAYFEGAGREAAAKPAANVSNLAKAASQYRLLVVPGFFSKCFSSSPAFDEGIKSLTAKGVQVELLSVPNESSESNGRFIADYVKRQMSGSDKRKFILVGYSKGTPDIQEGLARIPEMRNAVAAFVSVAGASGGSPIADAIPQIAEKYLTRVEDKACLGDLASSMKSLQKSVRQAFLASYPQPFVPTYSVAAVAEAGKMSSMLARTAALMSTFDPRHDGQLTLGDATIPGSKFLGVARADHFSIALPFDKAQGQMTAGQLPFPRAALLEAILEFVSADLTAKPVVSTR